MPAVDLYPRLLRNKTPTLPDSTTLCGQSFVLLPAFPEPKNTSATCLPANSCSGNPEVKWFTLKRSPNVPHPILSHGLAEFRQGIFATGLNRQAGRGAKVLDRKRLAVVLRQFGAGKNSSGFAQLLPFDSSLSRLWPWPKHVRSSANNPLLL
jgi:hypothetical protein